MRSIFAVAACVTLFVDAYLALALLATSKIRPGYGWALPPFGPEGLGSTPVPVVLLVLAWTAFLAVGCLSRCGSHQDDGRG
jgi:hypothetical protein